MSGKQREGSHRAGHIARRIGCQIECLVGWRSLAGQALVNLRAIASQAQAMTQNADASVTVVCRRAHDITNVVEQEQRGDAPSAIAHCADASGTAGVTDLAHMSGHIAVVACRA